MHNIQKNLVRRPLPQKGPDETEKSGIPDFLREEMYFVIEKM